MSNHLTRKLESVREAYILLLSSVLENGGEAVFVREIVKPVGAVCTEDMALEQLYRLMEESGHDYITVVENYAHRTPIGIITEREICRQVIGRGRNPKGLMAANVMDTHIPRARNDLTISECAALMQSKNAEKIFIVDENGALLETLSYQDIESRNTTHPIDSFISGEAAAYRASSVDRIF